MNLDLGAVVHLVGAGGSGMGALADLLLDRGVALSGSDLLLGEGVRRLRKRGVEIWVGAHRGQQVPENAGLLIHSAAVSPENPELQAARGRALLVLSYAEALGRLMGERHGVAIAGTHGKTTTTGLIAHALLELGADPSYVLGEALLSTGRAGAAGGGPLFVAEACEYEKSFLQLEYRQATLCSVEADHLDYYGDERSMRRAYRRFAERLPEGGPLILTPEALDSLGPELNTPGRIVTVSLEQPAEIRAADLVERSGFCQFRITGALETGPILCPVPGRHFAEDLLLAAANLHCLGLAGAEIARVFPSYPGLGRRLETVVEGEIGLLSDYAHHPTELLGVLRTLRQAHVGRRLLAVFQPHQASRTRYFLDRFAKALAGFDRTLVSDIFVTRDSREDQESVSAGDLVDRISTLGGNARHAGSLEATLRCVLDEMRKGDLILLLGAGDIDQLRDELEAALSPSH